MRSATSAPTDRACSRSSFTTGSLLRDLETGLDLRLDIKAEPLAVGAARRRSKEADVRETSGPLEQCNQRGSVVGQPYDAQGRAFEAQFRQISALGQRPRQPLEQDDDG